MPRDLEGITVVSIEQAVAAPYASGRLADAGARVIKVERPEGDFARGYDAFVHGQSAYFVWLNRGKESIRLNLKLEDDRAVLRRMILAADVFIQNLAPGAIERLGFAPDDLRRANPRLITCAISGYGDSGPYRNMKAYDLLVQAESGLSEITGNEAGPARVGVSVCDIAAGVTALQAITQALFARERTGRGRHVAVSLYHALADWMNVPYLQYVYGDHPPERAGLNHPTIAPYGVFACGDGKQILLSIQNEREWASLCENALDDARIAVDPRFSSNPKRVANRAALDAIMNGIFGALTREAVVGRLEKARVAYGRVSTLDDLKVHPQNRLVRVETPNGPVDVLAPGATHDGRPLVATRVPALGEHDAALRAEFGAA
jgi:crotonobetainyl-CoA:carnitine CoA-transferase CaiB-like acyl-CoA transferase